MKKVLPEGAQSVGLSKKEIHSFLKPSPYNRRWLVQTGLSLTGLCIGFASVYFLLNISAFMRIQNVQSSWVAAAPSIKVTTTPTVTQPAAAQAVAPVSTPTPTPAAVATANPLLPDNTLIYQGLSISAPIHWDTPFDESTVQNQLQSGITHIKGTAKPGQKGTVVIFGHSSNYPWSKGSYNTVFAPLSKAQTGSEIIIQYNGSEYRYQVTKIYPVNPDQLEVLKAGSQPSLRLITCTPIGTSLRRLVVEATQISPDPAQNSSFTHANFDGSSLPAAR